MLRQVLASAARTSTPPMAIIWPEQEETVAMRSPLSKGVQGACLAVLMAPAQELLPLSVRVMMDGKGLIVLKKRVLPVFFTLSRSSLILSLSPPLIFLSLSLSDSRFSFCLSSLFSVLLPYEYITDTYTNT